MEARDKNGNPRDKFYGEAALKKELRDRIAMAALIGLINAYTCGMVLRKDLEELPSNAQIVEMSYDLADAMLAERDKVK